MPVPLAEMATTESVVLYKMYGQFFCSVCVSKRLMVSPLFTV